MTEKITRIVSASGDQVVEIVQSRDGLHTLRKFVRKYDSEENKYYEIRELPNPNGFFGDMRSAIEEAKRVLEGK